MPAPEVRAFGAPETTETGLEQPDDEGQPVGATDVNKALTVPLPTVTVSAALVGRPAVEPDAAVIEMLLALVTVVPPTGVYVTVALVKLVVLL